MKVRRFRRQFQAFWRHLSRLAVVIVCMERLLLALLAQRAEADATPWPAPAQGEKLVSYPWAESAAST